ncbi:DUF5610 domain-containing protein [Gayadomonas joobiniege]|uniref:DUF5610 domain-containing protein n=1 Tax=Gayadomonas joobiniege TaxID=1234606 RepID=UPI00037FB656|nr:DUF5610 domain-containing protein [Gayadomonas joobiniege]
MDIQKLDGLTSDVKWPTKRSEQASQIEAKSVEQDVANLSDLAVYRYAQRVLQESISGQFETPSRAEMPDPEAIKEKNESLFDFEAVIDNVMSFVESRILAAKESGAQDDQLLKMLTQARQGVDDGVSQAKKILGVKDDEESDLALGIKQAHKGLFERIGHLKEKLFGETVEQGEVFNTISKQSSVSKFELVTNEGDKVFVSLSQFTQLEYQNAALADGQLTQTGRQTWGSLFQLTVEGDLNDEEKSSIESLFKQMNEIGQSFWDGNLKNALEQAKAVGLDESQIASANLAFSTKSVSVSAYQPKSMVPDGIKTEVKEYLDKLTDVVRGLDKTFDKNQKEQLVRHLFAEQFDLKGNELIEAVNHFNHFNGQLLERQS